jgi:hypothetical protein
MSRTAIRPSPIAVLAALGLVALGGCAPRVEAPSDAGVCWHMVPDSKGALGGRVVGGQRFYKLQGDVSDLEHCAAALEAMRVRFLALGGSQKAIAGAYQGQFLFIDPRGVFTASDLQTTPFPMLVRTGDGRLVPPGSTDNTSP